MDEKRPVMNYPSNSKFKPEPRQEDKQEKKVEKVVSGTAVQKKKSFGKKVLETFVGEDIGNVREYLIHDVFVPAVKSTLSDMVQGGIDMMLFGEKRGSRTTRDRGRSYVNYGGYSSMDKRDNRGRDERKEMSNQSRARHDFGDIVFPTRGDAEVVLSHLVDLTIEYGQATVADLYDLAGITSNYTDDKYGWTNLSRSDVSPIRGGYVINLPRPILID